MSPKEIQQLYQELKKIQQKIESFKLKENHFEKDRLLKLIDAELLDALHNMESLVKLTSE